MRIKEAFVEDIQLGKPRTVNTSIHTVAAKEYLDPDIFAVEKSLFQKGAIPVGYLGKNDEGMIAFRYMDREAIAIKDSNGELRGFFNSCAHRGTKIIKHGKHKCRKMFACPYHNWIYKNDGSLHKVPHEYGFPQNIAGLTPIPVFERFGLIWAAVSKKETANSLFEPPSFDFLNQSRFAGKAVYKEEEFSIPVNWKLIVESGLEMYHFKTTHAKTIYPRFFDNIGTVEKFTPDRGNGLRVLFPMRHILQEKMESENLADFCNIVYYFFPATQVLVEDNLVNVIRMEPVSPAETKVKFTHLVPKEKAHLSRLWEKRVAFTHKTLREDFEKVVSIQEAMACDPDRSFVHGSFEYGLGLFHEMLRSFRGNVSGFS
ncbi:MAG: SRPBCC family protein [Spirochaetota bacterium]